MNCGYIVSKEYTIMFRCHTNSISSGFVSRDMLGNNPLRREFDVFWKTSLADKEVSNTAAVCKITRDKGETILTRIFFETAADGPRAEDRLVEWLPDEPFWQDADEINIKIYLSYSPQGATSEGIVNFLHDLEAQGIEVNMTIRFASLYRVGTEDEATENKDGLRLLHNNKVKVDVVRECDWVYLMDVLKNRQAQKQHGRRSVIVRQELTKIFTDPRDEETSTDQVTADSETMTEKVGYDVRL
ncbi:uncharacterized protein LOC124133011 [Haliotis rufescens]|uniref:uncharacterized protein LOC124133011 n=1 Tax=Haliotis rufescens TaxID=6454 RepID=UPI00201F8939|nr:uncharacterized protein LOC124133011 [Haliotis rufescens]